MINLGGMNMAGMKESNQTAILRLLRRNGPTPRKDIAAAIGLTPASVTILTGEMIEAGLLFELGTEVIENRAGRRKILVDIKYSSYFVLAVSIESDSVNTALCRLNGETISQESIKIQEFEAPELVLSSITLSMLRHLWDNQVQKSQVIGVGVGIVGKVDTASGTSLHAYGLWNAPVAVTEWLERELGLPVCIENNVKALALAEIDYGLNRAPGPQLFVKLGPGIGSAIISDGRLYCGANNRAGEIGHVIVEGNRRTCRCGRIGCLETVSSPQALINICKSMVLNGDLDVLAEMCGRNPEDITALQIIKLIEGGERKIVEAMRKPIEHLAAAIINAAQLLDPSSVVLYGTFLNNSAMLHELKDTIHKLSGNSSLVELISHCYLAEDAPHLGAAAIAVRQYFLGDKTDC